MGVSTRLLTGACESMWEFESPLHRQKFGRVAERQLRAPVERMPSGFGGSSPSTSTNFQSLVWRNGQTRWLQIPVPFGA